MSMNHPMAPATTATIVPARKALTMNGNSNSWRTSSSRFQVKCAPITGAPPSAAARDRACVHIGSLAGARSRVLVAVGVVRGRFRLAHDDEAAVRRLEHLNRRAEQAGQGFPG